MKINIILIGVSILLFANISAQTYDTLSIKIIHPGCSYYQLADTSMPVAIYLLEADLTNPDLDLVVEIANDSLNLGSERTSSMSARKIAAGSDVLAAVNADFFGDKPMQAQNSIVRNGELIKAVNLKRSLISSDESNTPDIGMYEFNGRLIIGTDTLTIDAVNSQDSTHSLNVYTHYWHGIIPLYKNKINVLCIYDGLVEPNNSDDLNFVRLIQQDENIELEYDQIIIQTDILNIKYFQDSEKSFQAYYSFSEAPDKINTMTGGLPGLFKAGKIPESYYGREGMKIKRFIDKNPRTAIGYDKSRTKLFIAAIDGRQPGYSMGMTLKELAEFMQYAGCYEALNLDGGGSTTMTLRDSLVNKPSDRTGERAVFNSLMIVSKTPYK